MRNDGSFLFFFEKFLFSSFQNGMNARQIKKKKKGGARVLRVLAFRRFLVDRIEALQSDQQY